jgi:hypothetical protein
MTTYPARGGPPVTKFSETWIVAVPVEIGAYTNRSSEAVKPI